MEQLSLSESRLETGLKFLSQVWPQLAGNSIDNACGAREIIYGCSLISFLTHCIPLSPSGTLTSVGAKTRLS